MDIFPCISWPMGTGTLEHDTTTGCQPGKVSPALTGQPIERGPDGYL